MSELDRYDEPEWVLPFDHLGVGDSFFVPTLRPANLIYIIDIRAKEARVKVRAYTASKDGSLGVRVWRVR
jgi:hypothetical protein